MREKERKGEERKEKERGEERRGRGRRGEIECECHASSINGSPLMSGRA